MDVVEREQLPAEGALGHWYYQAKLELLLSQLKKIGLKETAKVTDVGCGMGLFMTFLEQSGRVRPENLLGIDPAFAGSGTALGGTGPIVPRWPAQHTSDLVLMMDVLEHTPDDLGLLRDATSHLAGGGYAFITVPAFSWLFSAHDRFLQHYRRYSIGDLRRLIQNCGDLEIVSLHYYYACVLPMAIPWRLARRSASTNPCSDLKAVPRWLNWTLKLMTQAELTVADKNQIAGLSVVALCRKLEVSKGGVVDHGIPLAATG